MKGLQVYVVEDVHEVFGIGNEGNATTAFDSMVDMEMELEMEGETKDGGGNEAQDREIWLERQLDEPLDVNDASIFYAEFTPLPDFPCMSSSSSSSSTPTPVKAMTCSSSSSASFSSSAAFWAALKPDADEDVERSHTNHEQHDLVDASTTALSSTASMEIPQALTDQQIDADDCMDMMETFGYMDLFENNDFFDHSSIFQIDDEKLLEDFQQVQQDFTQQEEQQRPPHPQHGNKEWTMPPTKNSEDTQQGEGGGKGAASDDLAMVFLEWLKTNKESVSAEDLRKVKIKKATIECAARRLGGGKEAMKQLLKLILEWVQTNHLQKRRMRASSSSNPPCQYQDSLQNPSTNPILKPSLNCTNSTLPDQSNPCFTQSPWIPTAAPYVAGPETVVPGFPSMVGYMGDPFTNGASNINGHLYPPPADYHVLESGPSWPGSQFAMASHYTPFADNNLHHSASPHLPATFTRNRKQYSYQYAPGQGESLVGPGSSATKEARKKRMARQRRFLSHHRRQSHPKSQQQQNLVADPHAGLGIGNDNGAPPGRANLGNWAYWPTATSAAPVATSPAPPVLPLDAQPAPSAHRPAMQLQAQHYQRQLASERRQGWKPEKNLRFLLQKVLKQSDVGNLGRIVLPKKEAETHLPELEARDGISIVMEDIGTSRVWNMRYRFWPNNKSRMYLLENTGDFVRTNGLQEGDFIVIYSDLKCGKYLIRGVKVRHAAPKAENKRSGKSERNWHARSASNASGSSSKPVPQMQTQLHTQTVN